MDESLHKWCDLLDQKGIVLDDITGNLGVLLDDSIGKTEEDVIMYQSALDFVNEIYELAVNILAGDEVNKL